MWGRGWGGCCYGEKEGVGKDKYNGQRVSVRKGIGKGDGDWCAYISTASVTNLHGQTPFCEGGMMRLAKLRLLIPPNFTEYRPPTLSWFGFFTG